MEQNLVLPALPGGSQSKGSSSLALPGAQPAPLNITHDTAADLGSNLALTLFLLQGDEDFLENQGQGLLGEVEQTPGFFSFIKKRSRREMVPSPCARVSHTGSAWVWWLDIPCWQVLGMVYPGEETKTSGRKTSPVTVSGSPFSHR